MKQIFKVFWDINEKNWHVLSNNTILSLTWTLLLMMTFTVCPQAYTEELVDLHRRLMALRERNVLQQVCVHVSAEKQCFYLLHWNLLVCFETNADNFFFFFAV